MEDEVFRLIGLELTNVLTLSAVRIQPDRTMVRIEGRNMAGKSAVLDGFCWAMGGRAGTLERPVREGEKKARALLDFGDLHVERTATAKGGGGLTVTDAASRKAGIPLASPQAILDRMWGQSVDPVAFINAPPKEQADTLMRLAGLDWTELDAKRDTLYKERTVANAAARIAKARCGTPVSKPSDMTQVGIAEITKKQEEAVEHNGLLDKADAVIQQADYDVDRNRTAGIETERRLAQAIEACATALVEAKKAHEEGVAEAQATHKQSVLEADRLRAERGDAKRIELGNLTDEITAAQAHNDSIKAYSGYQERTQEADARAAEANKLTEGIEAIDEEKTASLACATFPLPELGLDDMGSVTLNGIPLSQASQAEQLRTGVALSLAEGFPCRVIPIRNGSLLDEDGLRLLNDLAIKHDAQILLERVAETPTPGAVFIKDGEVVE